MEFKELKNKTEKELHKVLSESRDKLRDLRFKDANKQLKNVREIKSIRETIARAMTILNSKKLNKFNSDKEVKKEEVQK